MRESLQTSLGSAYTVERELGGGGMSRVFVAEEAALGRRVVVKVLAPEMAASVSIERFKREIAFAARLQHPHIVPLLNAGDAGGVPYFTMPYIEGQSLRARLTRDGELPINEGIRILREIASALDYAHDHGVVHRDIKPDNVLLSRGSAMVTDFGVAKALSASSTGDHGSLTSVGVALGTPAYMSPEQAAASPTVDARADIYAWGILAYELFVGRPPFAGRSVQAVLAAHVTEAPEAIAKLRAHLPPALASLIMRCLEKHPADRPQTAADLIHALDAIATPSAGLMPTSAQPPVTGAPPADSKARSFRRRPAVALAAALVLVAIAVGTLARLRSRNPAANSAAPAKSVAVIPFENAGGNAADEYLSDGISDELTTALSIPGLRVMSRSSAFSFKRKGLTARQIGDSLKVGYVVEGQVRRADNRLRILAQLVNVADGTVEWSNRYDRSMADVLTVQEEIARSIAGELKVALGGSSRLALRGTSDIEAHDLYLKGRFAWNQRTKAGTEDAIRYFSAAVARDSGYALAWVGLADGYLLAPGYAGMQPSIAYPAAERAARHALALDSAIAEAHATLGHLRGEEARWAEAEAEYKRAIELRPDYATAHHWYSQTLRSMGRFDSSLAEIRRAEALDPASLPISVSVGLVYIHMRDYDRAIAQLERSAARFPDNWGLHYWLGTAYAMKGENARAEQELRIAETASGNGTGAWLGWFLAKTGRRAEADSILRHMTQLAKQQYISRVDFASIHAALGDKDAAFRELDAAAAGEGGLDLAGSPFYDPLRDDPRFAALMRRMNVPVPR